MYYSFLITICSMAHLVEYLISMPQIISISIDQKN